MLHILAYGEKLTLLTQRKLASVYKSCHLITAEKALSINELQAFSPGIQLSDKIALIDLNSFSKEEEVESAVTLLAKAPPLSFLELPTSLPSIWNDLTPNRILDVLKHPCSFPFAAYSFTGNDVKNISEEALYNYRVVGMLLRAKTASDSPSGSSLLSHSLKIRSEEEELSPFEKSLLLTDLLKKANIEDFFTSVSWHIDPLKQAAACYTEISTIFLTFNDSASALECLNLAESFGEAPRMGALRGIIAVLEGQTLTAVANMVSSLQHYEEQPKDTSQNSLTPEVEKSITHDLKFGLKALNRRDNKKALEHFARALYNYDDYYSQMGLDRFFIS
jgi:tetratricopeptide (TPR) repeat protein